MSSRGLLLGIGLLGLAAVLGLAFLEAGATTAPLGRVASIYNLRSLEEVGATNVISAINFDWRAYDTLGEATILLTAATGVSALLRRYLQRRRETGIS
ncbi:MAG: hydrogen gas-evolving membrane-bound hydrogenase subunit E [Candidatus Promineifilaceae bacterium]